MNDADGNTRKMLDKVSALSVGRILGGHTIANKIWREGLDQVWGQIEANSVDASSPLNVNVVFIIGGNLLTPDFEGVRTGSYFKSMNALTVQVAIPESIEVGPDGAESVLLNKMRDAIDEAERWQAKHRRSASLEEIREVVELSARGIKRHPENP